MIAAFSICYQLKTLKNELDTRNWLGRHSYSRQDEIKRSGLWNSEKVVLTDELSLSGSAQIDESVLSLLKLKIVLEDLTQNIKDTE